MRTFAAERLVEKKITFAREPSKKESQASSTEPVVLLPAERWLSVNFLPIIGLRNSATAPIAA